jgi:hypothetical protein
MGRRVLPVALVLLAVVVDRRGSHALATLLLVCAVPAAAAAALTAFGGLVQLPGKVRGTAAARAQVALGAFALVAVVAAAAARESAVDGAAVPPLAVSGVIAALAAYGLQGLVALVAPVRLAEPRGAARRTAPAEQPEPARAA